MPKLRSSGRIYEQRLDLAKIKALHKSIVDVIALERSELESKLRLAANLHTGNLSNEPAPVDLVSKSFSKLSMYMGL